MLKYFSSEEPDLISEVLSSKPSFQSEGSHVLPPSLIYRKFVNWMSFLLDQTKLFEICLPGTINSAIYSFKAMEDILKNQNPLFLFDKSLLNENFQIYDIFSQLMAGVRFLSFECRVNKENTAVLTVGEREAMDLAEGMSQINDFFDRFNKDETEFVFLSFNFQISSKEQEEILKGIIGKSLKIEVFALKSKDFSISLSVGEMRKFKKRYILLSKQSNCVDEFFSHENEVLIKSNMNHLFEKKENNLEESTKNLMALQEYSALSDDLTPAFLEKTYGKLIDSHLQSLIANFHISTNLIPNICSRQLINQSPTFIGQVIFLNHLKGNMQINEYLTLLFHTNDHFFEDYAREKSIKYSSFGSFKLGLPNIPGKIQVFKQTINHRVFFESLLTTCFTKREEELKIEAPSGFILSYIDIFSESDDKTNKFKIVITDGWVLEKSISLRIKALRSFEAEIFAEAVPLSKKLVSSID